MSGFRFPPPWQAAAGFGGLSFEVLIHGLDLLPAVAAAQPAGVAMGVAGDEARHHKATKAFVEEGFREAWHGGAGLGFKRLIHLMPCIEHHGNMLLFFLIPGEP